MAPEGFTGLLKNSLVIHAPLIIGGMIIRADTRVILCGRTTEAKRIVGEKYRIMSGEHKGELIEVDLEKDPTISDIIY